MDVACIVKRRVGGAKDMRQASSPDLKEFLLPVCVLCGESLWLWREV